MGEERKESYSTKYVFANGKAGEVLQVRCENQESTFFRKAKETPDVSITKYGRTCQILQEKKLDDPGQPIELFGSGERLFLFNRLYNSKTRRTSFYTQPYNPVTLETAGARQDFGEFDAAKVNSEESQVKSSVFHSADSSKTLLMISPPYETPENEKYHFVVLDRGMNKIWDKSVELPFRSNLVDIESSFITNDGRVCVIVKIYNNDKKQTLIKNEQESTSGYATRLFIYNNNAPVFVYDIKANGQFVHNVRVVSESNGSLKLVGLYMKIANTYLNGYFTVTLPMAGSGTPDEKCIPFPKELLSQVNSDAQGNENGDNAGLSGYFQIGQVLTENNGTIHCLLEYEKVEDINTGRGVISYFMTGDIIGIKLDSSNVATFTRIARYRIDGAVSSVVNFAAMMYKGKLVVMYFDKEKNLPLKPTDIAPRSRFANNGKGEVLIMTVVENDGSFKRSVMYNNEQDLRPSILNATRLDDNKFAFIGYSGLGVSRVKRATGILEIH